MRLRYFPLALLLLTASVTAASPGLELFKKGQKAERAGQIVQAYLFYSEAAAAEPANTDYWAHAVALRPMASLQATAKLPFAETEVAKSHLDPNLFGHISDREMEEARQPLPPASLNAKPGRQDLDLRGDGKQVFEEGARALGLMVVFDSAYQPALRVRLQLEQADYREALRALQDATGSFLVPVSDRLIFVANDNPQKRTEFERTAAVVVSLPEATTPQELQEMVTAVRGVMDIQRMLVDNQRHAVLMRDRASKVRSALSLFQELLLPRAQVAVEVEILSTDQNSSLSYGLSLPTSYPLVSLGPRPGNLLTAFPAGFLNFFGFGGGGSFLGVGVTNASLFANVSKASAATLLKSEVTTLDGQPATMHVGEKYPIATNQYIGDTSSGGRVFTPPPSFNFEDLGLVLKITPRIHGPDEVSLDIDAEVKLLGAGSYNGIPVISSRKYESKVRVREGEWAVVAGLMSSRDARTITGIPGVMAIPLLRQNTHDTDFSQTLIVLKPHVLVLPPSETATGRTWVGTETRSRTL